MFQLREIQDNHFEELMSFRRNNGWKTNHDDREVRRFLSELISSPDMVLDLWDQKGRAGLAVLVDQIQNPSNDANLEILGVRSDVSREALRTLVNVAKQKTPRAKAGFQVGVSERNRIAEEFWSESSLSLHYTTSEMLNSRVQVAEADVVQIRPAVRSDAAESYTVLRTAFAENLDTSVPTEDIWNERFVKSPFSHYFVWRENGRILGFANLIEPSAGEETEVRTIGVLPECRGRGLGRKLLNHCLMHTLHLGYRRCRLSVAARNERALHLYKSCGFEITERFLCYRWASV